MPDLPLPRLLPNDPQNLLSNEARQRIARSFLEFERIRKRARSDVHLSGYWDTPKGWAEIRHAEFEAAHAVLQVDAEELGRLGLPDHEFRELIRTRIEACVNSLEFSNLQRDSLEADFLLPPYRRSSTNPEVPESKKVHPLSRKRNVFSPSAAAKVEAYLRCNGITREAFAEEGTVMNGRMTKIGGRTLIRFLSQKSASPTTLLVIAKKMGITYEELLKVDEQ
jgi:hypothetical protein